MAVWGMRGKHRSTSRSSRISSRGMSANPEAPPASQNSSNSPTSPDSSSRVPLTAAYQQLALSVLLSAAAQVFLKLGAGSEAGDEWLGFSRLHSGWVWMGIGAMVASLFSWLYSLR